MKPGIANYRIEETRGDDWLWAVRFRTSDGTPCNLSGVTISANLSLGSSRRAVSLFVDGDPTTGNAQISIPAVVSVLYPAGVRTRLIISAIDVVGAETQAIFGLRIIDADTVSLLARSVLNQISVESETVTLTIVTVSFPGTADVTPPTITTPSTATCPENSTLSLNLTASESVTWTLIGGTDQSQYEISGHTLRWLGNGTKNFEAPDDSDSNNIFEAEVRATDLSGNTATKFIDVTVTNVNDAPTVQNAIPDQNTNVGDSFSFQFASDTFADEDVGDTLTYGATLSDLSPLPAWLTFTAATRTFSGTPGSGDVGIDAVLVKATDSGGLSATAGFNLAVASVAADFTATLLTEGAL